MVPQVVWVAEPLESSSEVAFLAASLFSLFLREKGQGAEKFGGLSCLSPPAVPTSTTAPPHPEAVGPLAFFAGPGGSPHHQTARALINAAARLLSSSTSPSPKLSSTSRVPPGPQTTHSPATPIQTKVCAPHSFVNAAGSASAAALPPSRCGCALPRSSRQAAHPNFPPAAIVRMTTARALAGRRTPPRTSGIAHRRDGHHRFPPARPRPRRADAQVDTARRSLRPSKVHSPHPAQLPRRDYLFQFRWRRIAASKFRMVCRYHSSLASCRSSQDSESAVCGSPSNLHRG